ncbi:MAG: hypothetical protein F6K19_40790, partial [Cyanothece sp. SIO1E1]|nr:hypothetical protein [Cyanothece sp. SIO1E1]
VSYFLFFFFQQKTGKRDKEGPVTEVQPGALPIWRGGAGSRGEQFELTAKINQTKAKIALGTEGAKHNLIILDQRLDCPFLGRTAPAIALPQGLGYDLQIVDGDSPWPILSPEHLQPTLLQVFIRGNPFRGTAGLTDIAQDCFQALVKAEKLQALVVYGSPYGMEQFWPELPPQVPYVFTYGQMQRAQAIALAALFEPELLQRGVESVDRQFTT